VFTESHGLHAYEVNVARDDAKHHKSVEGNFSYPYRKECDETRWALNYIEVIILNVKHYNSKVKDMNCTLKLTAGRTIMKVKRT
jgi:hypothetical protein